MSAEKVPYITRLESEKKRLTEALMLVLEYHKAADFVNITGYKADAIKKANALKSQMETAINEALKN